jgi:hypothetical protein
MKQRIYNRQIRIPITDYNNIKITFDKYTKLDSNPNLTFCEPTTKTYYTDRKTDKKLTKLMQYAIANDPEILFNSIIMINDIYTTPEDLMKLKLDFLNNLNPEDYTTYKNYIRGILPLHLFLKIFKGPFSKLLIKYPKDHHLLYPTERDEKHYDMQYKTGYNRDILKFNYDLRKIGEGRMHFADDEVTKKKKYYGYIRQVHFDGLDQNNPVFVTNNVLYDGKANYGVHEFILGPRAIFDNIKKDYE